MATAILQLDIDRLPPAVDVSKEYPQALVLVRRRGIPVGQFYVPVRAGSLDMESCARSLAIATRRRRWQWEVDDYLGPADAIGPLPAARHPPSLRPHHTWRRHPGPRPPDS